MSEEPSRDRVIGENLARLRGERSQQYVADEMRKLGFEWAQATVWSIEKGKRPIRLAEAEGLASVLKMDLNDLLQVPTKVAFQDAQDAVIRADSDLHDAADRLEYSLELLARSADQLLAQGHDRDEIERGLELGLVRFEASPSETLAKWERAVGGRRRPAEAIGPFTEKYLSRADLTWQESVERAG